MDGELTGGTSPASWTGNIISQRGDGSRLQFLRNRYYDPQTGRFTQQDPIGLAGGLNLYGFAQGDPVNLNDPLGLCPPCAAAYIGFEVASGVWDAYETYRAFKRSGAEGAEALRYAVIGGIAPGPGNLYRRAAGALDELSDAARAADRSGLTRAGRALTKHAAGQRAGSSPFGRLSGTADEINSAAHEIVDDILTHPGSEMSVIQSGRFRGGVEVFDPSGRGVRYNSFGTFVGFVQKAPQ